MGLPLEATLLTGGTGRLGTQLVRLLPYMVSPPRAELDITSLPSITAAVDRYCPKVLVHAAAYTNVADAEQDRETCWRVNVEGTRNIVQVARDYDIFLIHISTDYVFEGKTGMYCEHDSVGPVSNYYALTKLVAEQLVQFCPKHLTIRTSFRPSEWPYSTAFTDLFTSQDYVDVIAPELALAISNYDKVPYQTLHIATHRKSVYELAKSRKPEVKPGSKRGVGVALPDDVSLNTERWQRLKVEWNEGGLQ